MISAEMFKSNCLIRIKTFNRMPQRSGMKVTREVAERYLGGRVAETDEEWEAKVKKAMADLSVSRKLITCPEMQAVTSEVAAIKSEALRRYCNRSGIDDGLFLIKTELVSEANRYISERLRLLLENQVPALMAVYPGAVAAVKALWGEDGARKLPEVDKLPGLFGVTSYAIQFEVPEGLPPEIRAEEEAKLRASFEQARAAIQAALWSEFQELVDHLIDRLQPAEDGTKKKFTTSSVENIQAFCDAFSNRNSFNDEKLQACVTKAKEILGAVGANDEVVKRIKDYETVKLAVKDAFTALKGEVDKGVEEVGRTFDFSEDTEATA
jgi:hypothetical protein